MKFVLFVEGVTEKLSAGQFLKRWLDARLSRSVRVMTVRANGVSDYYDSITKKVDLHLSGPRAGEIIAAVGLLDLYGLERAISFPPEISSVDQRCAWAKKHLETKVGHPSFRQHFAVHEVEAWLLSEPAIFPIEVRREVTSKSGTPEGVNFNNPPARFLATTYASKLKRKYIKTADGSDLFRSLDPNTAYTRCPNLRAMLDDMLALATRAGL